MPGRVRWLLSGLLLLLLCWCPPALGQEAGAEQEKPARWIATGGDIGVWIAREDGEQVDLLLGQRDGEALGLRRTTQVGEMPLTMVGTAGGPMLFFEARGDGDQRLYPVRLGSFEDRAGIALIGSLGASAPLRTEDRLVSGVEAGGLVFVLLERGDADGGARLLRLEKREWVETRLPVELSDASLVPDEIRLIGLPSGLGVLVRGEVAGEASLWTLRRPADAGDAVDRWDQWERTAIQFDVESVDLAAVGLDDETVVVTAADGEVECLVLRRQGAIPFAGIVRDGLPGAIVTHGGELWLIADGSEGALAATVLDRDGSLLAEGELAIGALRGGGDGFVFLLLVAWSVVISVMVLAMPQNRQVRVVLPPNGFALAEPSRRLLAAILDLLPGIVLVSLVYGKSPSWWFGPLSEIIAADGSLPVFTLAWVTFGVMALGDGVFGRTLGKAILGLRVVTEDGSRPGLRRGVARSFFKVFCPPLVVVLLLMPYAPAPWSFGTVVIRKASESGPQEPPAE